MGNVQSGDASRPITCERKPLIDYYKYSVIFLWRIYFHFTLAVLHFGGAVNKTIITLAFV